MHYPIIMQSMVHFLERIYRYIITIFKELHLVLTYSYLSYGYMLGTYMK